MSLFFWAKRDREPGSTRTVKRRETRAGLTLPLQKRLHTGSRGEKRACLLRQDIRTPSTPTQFCLRPRLHPRAFLAKRQEKWVIFPKTQWCGVCLSACLPATKASILIFLIPRSTWGHQSWTKELSQFTDLHACSQWSFGRGMDLKLLIKMQSVTNFFQGTSLLNPIQLIDLTDSHNNLFLSLI